MILRPDKYLKLCIECLLLVNIQVKFIEVRVTAVTTKQELQRYIGHIKTECKSYLIPPAHHVRLAVSRTNSVVLQAHQHIGIAFTCVVSVAIYNFILL